MGRKLFFVLNIAIFLVGLSHILSHALPFRYAWGFNLLTFFPGFFTFSCSIILILIFIPYFNNKIQFLIEKIASSKIPLAVPVLLFFVIFISSPVTTHFLGDGYLWLRTLSHSYPPYASEILNLFVHRNLFLIMNRLLDFSVLSIYRVTSIASGLLFIYIMFKLISYLEPDRYRQPFLFLPVVTSGFMQLFFGYVEHYAVIFSITLLYIYVSIKSLKDASPPVLPPLVLGISSAFHLISFLYFPSLIYQNLKKFELKSTTFWFYSSLPLIIYCSIFTLIFVLKRQPLNEAIKTYQLVSLAGIFSINRAIDLTNLHLLIGPCGLLLFIFGLVLFFRKIRWRDPFFLLLLIMSLAGLGYSLIFESDKGPARDWDLLSIAALPYTVLGAYLFVHYLEDKKQLGYLMVTLTAVSLIHTIPWLMVNRNHDVSINRFQKLMDVNPERSSSAHEEIAIYYRERKMYDRAEQEHLTALRMVPTNARYWRQLGYLYTLMNNNKQAITAYRKSIGLDPKNFQDHINLGNVYRKLGLFLKANAEYQEALKINPQLWIAYFNQALVYTDAGQIDSAIFAYQKCLVLNPHHTETNFNLGTIYASKEIFDEAIVYLRKAASSDPKSAAVHYNLAWSLDKNNQYQEAISVYQLAIRLDPNLAQAYNNLGMIYERLGELDLAEWSYQQALRIKPDLLNAWHNLQRLKKKE